MPDVDHPLSGPWGQEWTRIVIATDGARDPRPVAFTPPRCPMTPPTGELVASFTQSSFDALLQSLLHPARYMRTTSRGPLLETLPFVAEPYDTYSFLGRLYEMSQVGFREQQLRDRYLVPAGYRLATAQQYHRATIIEKCQAIMTYCSIRTTEDNIAPALLDSLKRILQEARVARDAIITRPQFRLDLHAITAEDVSLLATP